MPKAVAAIDHGTTSTRCMLFDHEGRVLGKRQLEHRQIMERPGWVEHDPLEVWRNTRETLQGALADAGLGAGDVAALGVTTQRETTTVWNRHTGEPLANAIVWQDTRTQRLCDRLAEEGGPDRFKEKTGLPLATYFSSSKLHWLLENVPGLREAAERGDALFGTPDTWLIWNLTGGPEGGAHVTDVSNASRTQLMDLRSLDWDDELLATFGVPRAMLPEIRPSSDPTPWGRALGRIPVCGDLGDQQAALFGQTCFDEGDAKNTFGTGCFLLMNTGREPVLSRAGLLTTVAYQLGDEPATYALEGSAAIAGALVQWLRDNLDFFDFAQHVEDYARSVEDNGGVYIVPAFSGLYAPYWREDARGVIVGLTRFVTKGHLCRAALEANAYQARDLVEAMDADAGRAPREMKVDGGMVHNELFMQFQADLLGMPVLRPAVAETTALGAAYAAGLAVGFWDGLDDLRAQWRVDRTWEPGMDEARRASLYHDWKRAVDRSLGWVE